MPSPSYSWAVRRESLAVAEAIKAGLADSGVDVRLWSDGVFRPSTFALESLEAELARADFAALVLAPDDTVISRDVSSPAPRDNVVFELGLFMGALGHARTFLVLPESSLNKIPSDLDGFTSVTYQPTVLGGDLRCAVESACRDLERGDALGRTSLICDLEAVRPWHGG